MREVMAWTPSAQEALVVTAFRIGSLVPLPGSTTSLHDILQTVGGTPCDPVVPIAINLLLRTGCIMYDDAERENAGTYFKRVLPFEMEEQSGVWRISTSALAGQSLELPSS